MNVIFKVNSVLTLGILTLMLCCVGGCCTLRQVELTVKKTGTYVYRCENGDSIHASYCALADDSLHFVRLRLPDGREQTLPQALSASGARYTNDTELVWWIKGDAATLEIRDSNGNWQMKYRNCQSSLAGK